MTAAERSARNAAREVSAGDRTAAFDILRGAELTITRRLLARLLPDGEDGYWKLVEKELRE